MPAQTAERRSAYSSGEIWRGLIVLTPLSPAGGGGCLDFLVRGKSSHRLRDLLRVGHEEILLRGVERHCGNIRPRYAHHRPVEAVESMLRDDRHDFSSEPTGQIVLVHHHRLARLQ